MISRVALAVALAWAHAQPAAAQPASLAEINAGLDAEEQAQLARLLTRLAPGERDALIDVAGRLYVPAGDLLVVKMLQAAPDQKAGMARFLGILTPAQRIELAQQLGGRAPAVWDALFRYAGLVPAAEAAAMLFDPGFTQSALIYQYAKESGQSEVADRPDMVKSAKDANLDAAEEFDHVWNPPPGVSGGTPVAPHSAPWQVQIYKSGASASALSHRELRQELADYGMNLEAYQRWHNCGGALISQRWVLTAAHCIQNPRLGEYIDTRRVRTGTDSILEGGTTWRISAVVRHGGYDPKTKRNDIALIRIAPDGETRLTRNRWARPIRIATLAGTPLKEGAKLLVTGWGVTSETEMGIKGRFRDRFGMAKRPSPRLLEAELQYFPLSRCNGNANYRTQGYAVAQGQICAGGDYHADACQGDSGGPLVLPRKNQKAILVGLVSFGPGCGLEDTPGTYADVRYYGAWIQNAMKQAKPNAVIDWPPPR